MNSDSDQSSYLDRDLNISEASSLEEAKYLSRIPNSPQTINHISFIIMYINVGSDTYVFRLNFQRLISEPVKGDIILSMYRKERIKREKEINREVTINIPP